jgi:Mce-associated membrane protein
VSTPPSSRPARRRVAGQRPPGRPDDVPPPTGATAQPPVEDAAVDAAVDSAAKAPIPAPVEDEPVRTPVVHQPVAHEPVAHEPVAHEPVAHEPVRTPVVHEPGERQRRPVGTPVLAALAVLTVLVLAGVGVLVGAQRHQAAQDAAGAQALAVARTAAVTLLSYDHRHLGADFAAGAALTAPPFRDQYARTTSQAVQQVATQTQATVVAQVAAAGVQQAGRDQVTVLLFVNQTTTSNRLQRPQVDQNRVEMTLVRSGGRWLVSQVRGL